MLPLAWLLIRYATTPALIGLSEHLSWELDTRARAACGRLSDPKQRPPGELIAAVLVLCIAIALFFTTRPGR